MNIYPGIEGALPGYIAEFAIHIHRCTQRYYSPTDTQQHPRPTTPQYVDIGATKVYVTQETLSIRFVVAFGTFKPVIQGTEFVNLRAHSSTRLCQDSHEDSLPTLRIFT
jgi:hypothetical protein